LDPAIYLTFKCDVLLPSIAPHFAYGFCAKGVATRWPKICLHLLCIIGQGLVAAFQREWRMAWKFVWPTNQCVCRIEFPPSIV